MFRMLKLKPPHGWNAAGWELAVVTLGVLMALAAQQWVEDRGWRDKSRDATQALRQELAVHYAYAIEWRITYPCLSRQVDALRQRVLASGDRLNPAPTFAEREMFDFVIRIPSKEFSTTAWQASIADGVASHLDHDLRQELGSHYAQVAVIMAQNAQNDADYQGLLSLSRPIPLDPSVRFNILKSLDQLSGRMAYMDLESGQLIEHIQKAGMTPSAAATARAVERYGTFRFCRAQGLPMRSLADAMKPVPF